MPFIPVEGSLGECLGGYCGGEVCADCGYCDCCDCCGPHGSCNPPSYPELKSKKKSKEKEKDALHKRT